MSNITGKLADARRDRRQRTSLEREGSAAKTVPAVTSAPNGGQNQLPAIAASVTSKIGRAIAVDDILEVFDPAFIDCQ